MSRKALRAEALASKNSLQRTALRARLKRNALGNQVTAPAPS